MPGRELSPLSRQSVNENRKFAPSYTLAETRRKKIGLAKQNPLR
jgi:hypothetical protein